jgi:prepilin-type N-terminal cleavage/methylation domain-containing protein
MVEIRLNQGYSLLELAIVLAIVAFLIAGALTLSTQRITQNEIKKTRDEMGEIARALNAYAKAYGRLPCPAVISAVTGTAGYGKEADPSSPYNPATAGPNCASTTAVTGVERELISGTDHARIGAVPVFDIGLSDEYLGDAWNGRYLYVVDEKMVATGSMGSVTTLGELELTEQPPVNNVITNNGAWILISFGPSGRGSLNTVTGTANPMLCDAAYIAAYPLEGENCNYTANAVFKKAPFNMGSNATNFFDDIVLFSNKRLMLD